MAVRTWVLGSATEGYSVTKGDFKIEPWVSQVRLDGKIVRTDRHATKFAAIKYCRERSHNNKRGLKVHKNEWY